MHFVVFILMFCLPSLAMRKRERESERESEPCSRCWLRNRICCQLLQIASWCKVYHQKFPSTH